MYITQQQQSRGVFGCVLNPTHATAILLQLLLCIYVGVVFDRGSELGWLGYRASANVSRVDVVRHCSEVTAQIEIRIVCARSVVAV